MIAQTLGLFVNEIDSIQAFHQLTFFLFLSPSLSLALSI